MHSDYEHLILSRQRHEELISEGLRRRRAREIKSSTSSPAYRRLTRALGSALIVMGRHLRSL